MTEYRTISITPDRAKVFAKLMSVSNGAKFSEMLGRCAEYFLKEEHDVPNTPTLHSNFDEWKEYTLDCDKEDFFKLINFNTRLTNTIKAHTGKIRK